MMIKRLKERNAGYMHANSSKANISTVELDKLIAVVERSKKIIALEAENERLEKDANRYKYLRDRNIDTISKGGIFAGRTPDNIVLNGSDLDDAIDQALNQDTEGKE